MANPRQAASAPAWYDTPAEGQPQPYPAAQPQYPPPANPHYASQQHYPQVPYPAAPQQQHYPPPAHHPVRTQPHAHPQHRVVQPGYTTRNQTPNWGSTSLKQATLISNSQGYVPTRALNGWWKSGCGRVYMCENGEDCLCGIYMLIFCIPCPCFCACREGRNNVFSYGRGHNERLVIYNPDVLASYNICCDESPQYYCWRADGPVGC